MIVFDTAATVATAELTTEETTGGTLETKERKEQRAETATAQTSQEEETGRAGPAFTGGRSIESDTTTTRGAPGTLNAWALLQDMNRPEAVHRAR